MLGFGRDQGETRSREYRDELLMGSDGKIRSAIPLDLDVDVKAVLAEVFYAIAEQLELSANTQQQAERAVVQEHMFDSMVSGS